MKELSSKSQLFASYPPCHARTNLSGHWDDYLVEIIGG